MSNPNFVSDLVAMAKAFEELPQVQHELMDARVTIEAQAATIQRLELRLIERANEIDALHATTRKLEVERDHAEQMFLETDDRLNAFQRLLRSFQSDANSLVKASEPEPTEQVSLPQAEASPMADPVPASADPAHADLTSGQSDVGEPYASSGTVSASEHSAPASDTVHADHVASEGVSVPSDPTSSSAETSSENVSPVSTSGSMPLPEPGGFSMQPIQRTEAPAERPTDPTAAVTPTETGADVSSTGVSENSNASATSMTEPSPSSVSESVDDVGYHNEPKIGNAGGSQDWDAWDAWAERMNKRYPAAQGGWPQRPTQAAQ